MVVERRVEQQVPRSTGEWVEKLARAGYAAKGAVYAMVGIMALKAAFGSGDTGGTKQALREYGQNPFGQVLLALIGIGLLGYVAWRLVEAVKDPDHEGTDAEGMVKRIGYAVSGLTYLALAIYAFTMIGGGSGGSGSGSGNEGIAANLLSKPFGRWLVGLLGVIVVGVGLYQFYRAFKEKFMADYDVSAMSPTERTWARRLGKFGITARAVTFLIIGWMFVQAALSYDSSKAGGLEQALDVLGAAGPWVLALVGLGLLAYGVYCFSRAKYRHFPVG